MRPDTEVVVSFDLEDAGDAGDADALNAVGLDREVHRLRYLVVVALEGRGGSAEEALELLTVHRSAPDGVVLSALLVCTHPRFERCSRTLLRRLAADDLLAPDQLDELAGSLLWEGRVTFAIPSTWLSTSLEVPPGTRVRSSGHEVVPPAKGEQAFGHRHNVPAAGRRWAAQRLLESGRCNLDAVLARAEELEGGAAGAVVCGALDAWASLTPDEVEPAVRRALAWPIASVRLRALDVLARTGRRDEAVAVARADGAAAVRRWQPPAAAHARGPEQPTLLG